MKYVHGTVKVPVHQGKLENTRKFGLPGKVGENAKSAGKSGKSKELHIIG